MHPEDTGRKKVRQPMKKEYERPSVAVEHFRLSTAISGCITKIGFLDSACVYNDPDAPTEMRGLAVGMWFTAGHCLNVMQGGQSKDGICYHTNANATFSS